MQRRNVRLPFDAPTYPAHERFRETGNTDARMEGLRLHGGVPQDVDDQTFAAEIAVLCNELGDDAPHSSRRCGRDHARNLHRDAGGFLDRFVRPERENVSPAAMSRQPQ